jgi:hypothetical protein
VVHCGEVPPPRPPLFLSPLLPDGPQRLLIVKQASRGLPGKGKRKAGKRLINRLPWYCSSGVRPIPAVGLPCTVAARSNWLPPPLALLSVPHDPRESAHIPWGNLKRLLHRRPRGQIFCQHRPETAHNGGQVVLTVVAQMGGQFEPVGLDGGLGLNVSEDVGRGDHDSPAGLGQQWRQTSRWVSSGESAGGGMEKTTTPVRPQLGHRLVSLRAGGVPLAFGSGGLLFGCCRLSGIWAPGVWVTAR